MILLCPVVLECSLIKNGTANWIIKLVLLEYAETVVLILKDNRGTNEIENGKSLSIDFSFSFKKSNYKFTALYLHQPRVERESVIRHIECKQTSKIKTEFESKTLKR